MEIDYAAIIEKANTRKEILKEIQTELEVAPEILDAVNAAVKWLNGLNALYLRLDAEGKDMIPKPQRNGMNATGYSVDQSGASMLQVLRNLCGVPQ